MLGCCSTSFPNWTFPCDWCVVRWGSKIKHQSKHMLERDDTLSPLTTTHSIMKTIEETCVSSQVINKLGVMIAIIEWREVRFFIRFVYDASWYTINVILSVTWYFMSLCWLFGWHFSWTSEQTFVMNDGWVHPLTKTLSYLARNCDELVSWMIEIWIKNHSVSNTSCIIVNL